MSTISDALKKDNAGKYLLELDFDGFKVRLTNQTPASVPNSGGSPLLFDSKIGNVVNFSQRLDMRTPRYSAPSLSLDIINDFRFQDYEKGRRIDAGTWKIYLWSPSLDWSDIQDHPVAHGICRKRSHTRSTYGLELMDVAALQGSVITSLSAVNGHPADNIIYLLLGFSSVDIDYASLNAMKAVLPGFNFSTKVDSGEAVNVFDVVDRICLQLQGSRVNRFGKVGAVAFDLDGIPIGKITESDLIGATARFSITPFDLIANDVLAYYAPTGSPTTWSSLTVNKTNNDLCLQSFNEYGAMPQVTLYLPDVTTAAMAQACVKRYLEWRAFRHDIVEMEVPFWVGWDYLGGDVAELSLEDGSSRDGDGWVDEKCILLDRSFSDQFITQRWMRVGVD